MLESTPCADGRGLTVDCQKQKKNKFACNFTPSGQWCISAKSVYIEKKQSCCNKNLIKTKVIF